MAVNSDLLEQMGGSKKELNLHCSQRKQLHPAFDKPCTVSVGVCENEMYNSQLHFLKTEIHQIDMCYKIFNTT